ncbi:C2 calcium-dependent membrane targeting [Haematococcus lacustris]|uniref:C2 calcium-dependent membrane targeting n=1 Tax=Haematococcus lacustris TaxID=44745 RepID=A0A699Z0T6_HAELA|nr:C2 calcium-dependent membrane targeting [Haematococcus lacustris]
MYADELDEHYDEEIPVTGASDELPQAGNAEVRRGPCCQIRHFGSTITSAAAELEAMKKKLKEMEEESARLKALQSGGSADAAAVSGAAEAASKEEADSRSIYVGNVDYSCTPEELQQHFKGSRTAGGALPMCKCCSTKSTRGWHQPEEG